MQLKQVTSKESIETHALITGISASIGSEKVSLVNKNLQETYPTTPQITKPPKMHY